MGTVGSKQKVVVRMSGPAEHKRGWPWIPLAVLVLLGGLGLMLVNWEQSMAAAVYPGVRLGGIDIGGLTLAQAQQRLAPIEYAVMNRTITIVADNKRWTSTPQRLGLRLDVQSRLQAAYALGRESNVLDRYSTQLSLAVHGRDLPLVGNYDSEVLRAFVQQVAIAVYRSAQPAVVSLQHAQALLSAHASNGQRLDQQAATTLLAAVLADPHQPVVQLPVQEIVAPVSEEEGLREVAALQNLLRTRLHLRFAGRQWEMGANEIAPTIALTTVIANGGAATYQHSVDQQAIAHYVDGLAAQVDRPVQTAQVVLKGAAISVLPARSGYHLDRYTTRQVLTKAILQGGEQTISLAVGISAPTTPTDAAQRTAHQVAELIRRPLALSFGAQQWLLGPAQLGSVLAFTPTYDPVSGPQLSMHVDPARLGAVLGPAAAVVNRTPVDARFVVQGDQVHLLPSQAGRRINLAALAGAIQRRGRTMLLPILAQAYAAHFTTAMAQAMGIHDLLIAHSTQFAGSSDARLTNIHAAVRHLEGQLIAPGEIFSFNQRIGPITPDGGYVQGINIVDNQDVPGIGGGVCQVAVTLFQTAVFSGMKIVERIPHANIVSYYNPIGMDATVYVSANGPDVKFQNTTGHWLLIDFVEDLPHYKLTARFFGTNPHFRVVVRGPFSTQQPNGDVDAVFYRTVYDRNGKVLLDAHFTSHYVPVGS